MKHKNAEIIQSNKQLKLVLMIGIILIVVITGIAIILAINPTSEIGTIQPLGKYNEGYIQIEQDGKIGLIDNTGNIAVPCIYEEIKPFERDVMQGKLNGEWDDIENVLSTTIEPELFLDTAKYDDVTPFYKDFAVVSIGDVEYDMDTKYGVIDKEGNEIISPIYDAVYHNSTNRTFFSDDGLIPIGKKNSDGDIKWGMIDVDENIIIPFIYDYIAHFVDGLAVVGNGERDYDKHIDTMKFGFIDRDGNEVVPLIYDYAQSFSDGFAQVTIGKLDYFEEEKDYENYIDPRKCGFIDTKGNVVVPIIYNYADNFSNGISQVTLGRHSRGIYDPDDETPKIGFVDTKGDVVIPLIYDWIDFYYTDTIVVKKDDKYGIINTKGEEIIPLIYDNAGNFSDGLAMVEKDNMCGYIDINGNEVIPLIYGNASNLSEGLASVSKEKYIPGYDITPNTCGLIDTNGNQIIPPTCDSIGSFTDGFAVFTKHGLFGVMNEKGEEVISPSYTDLEFKDGFARVKTALPFDSQKYGIIDMQENIIIPIIYDYIDFYHDELYDDFNSENELITATIDGKRGYIKNPSQMEFKQDVKPLSDGLFGLFLDGNYSTVTDYFGNFIFEFDSAQDECAYYFAQGVNYIQEENYIKAEKSLLKAYELQPKNQYIEEYIITACEKQDKTEV